MPGPYLWADEHVELEGNTMNPDHADESDNDMPRAVEHALRKHNAINDELCRVVAGEVWQDMQADYDEIYGMWREEMRAARELERERDRLREALLNVARMAEVLKRPCSMDNPESAQAIRNSQYMSISYAAHDALEGKPNA
jgi:hypothetical protein